MSFKQVLQYEVMRSFDSSALTGSFQPIGTPLIHKASIIKMINSSGVDVTISIDGVNPHDILVAGSHFVYDITTNSPNADQIFAPEGRQYSVAGTASTGLIYLIVQYVEPA